MSLRTLISGLSLLRDSALVRELGERRLHLQRVDEIRRSFPTAKVHRNVILVGYRKDLIELGEGASVCEGTVLAFGDSHNGHGRIYVGDRSWIGQYNNFRAGGGDIVIGSGCLVSQFCSIVASNHSVARHTPIQLQPPSVRAGIRLEDDVWLGASVHVLPGLSIGQGAVIGAGSVVTRNVPAFEIWAGAPAKRIGERQ